MELFELRLLPGNFHWMRFGFPKKIILCSSLFNRPQLDVFVLSDKILYNILWNLTDAVINYIFLKNLCRYEIFVPKAFCNWIISSPVPKKLKKHEKLTKILRTNEYEWELTTESFI